MLYTDGPFISAADLTAIDPDVTTVATVESINLETVIQSAIEEAAGTLEATFQNFDYSRYGLSGSFMNGALFPFQDSTPRPRMHVGQIVIDSATTIYASPIKRWVTYLSLRNFYRTASNRKTTDKYDAKMAQLQRDIVNVYWPALKSSGLPIVFTPIAAPGSSLPGTGTWSSANVTGDNSGETWDVVITYVTANGESGPSTTQTVTATSIQVHSGSLIMNPPNLAALGYAPVIRWNVYASPTGMNAFTLQDFSANVTGSVVLGFTPEVTATKMGNGQTRDVNLTFIHSFFRG